MSSKLIWTLGTGVVAIISVASVIAIRNRRNKEKSKSLEDWLLAWVESKQLPCAQLLVVCRDEEVMHVCCGSSGQASDDGHGLPLERNAIFRIYSMTKPVTASLALLLAEKGIINLDDEVAKYLPCFADQRVLVCDAQATGQGDLQVSAPNTEALKQPMTIRHLLTHTSGISYGFFGSTVADEIFCSQFSPDQKDEWFCKVPLPTLVEAIAKTPLLFQPGEAWHYGWSLDVLGMLLEVAWTAQQHTSSGSKMFPNAAKDMKTAITLGELMRKELFEPLGMIDTGFEVPLSKVQRLVPCAMSTPGFGFQSPAPPGLFAVDRLEPCGNFESGGGGLVSTADDFMAFAQFLRTGCAPGKRGGKRLLSESSVALLRANALPGNADVRDFSFEKGAFAEGVGPGVGFGLGAMSVLTRPADAPGAALSAPGEFGWGGVASTWFFVDPDEDLTAVFMTQLVPSGALPLRPHLRWLAHRAFASNSK